MNTLPILNLYAILLLCAADCSFGGLLEYKCEIPEGLDKKIVLGAKDGTKIEADAHQIYRECYRQEWINAIRRHLAKGNVPLSLLFREDIQEWDIQAAARKIGKLEAEVMIYKACLIYKPEKLDELLRQLLIGESENVQAGADQPATKPVGKPPVKAKPSLPTQKNLPR